MKRTVGKDTYEILKNGKPLPAKAEAEAWMAFIPKWVHHIAVEVVPGRQPATFASERREKRGLK